MEVTFHILTTHTNPADKNLYGCRLLATLYGKISPIYVHTDDLREAQNLDRQLWTFHDISFIPHALLGDPYPAVPILIGYGENYCSQGELLLNLATHLPPSYRQYNQLVEIVPNDEPLKKLARERFRQYQRDGITIKTSKIK